MKAVYAARVLAPRSCRLVALWLGVWLVGASWAAPTGPPAVAQAASLSQADLMALGRRIYREGLRTTGEPVQATGAAQTRLAGNGAACVMCHRRSGYGTSEGRFSIRPITGPALRQQQEVPLRSPRIKARIGVSPRAPYTEALLARAVRNGVDSTNKPLDPVMPRYALNDLEMRALWTYLLTLSAEPSLGVDDTDIHFATVIQPGVEPERRRAMLEVMQAFFKDKDANVRLEEQRRAAGNMRMYRSYRKWVLHVWELSGPSGTWGAQLEALYRRQPVFALIGGLGRQSWQPIHEFSERNEVPCLFPQADLPVLGGANHYTLYLSRGLVLEAEVLAKFFAAQGAAPQKVVQVYRRGESGAEAAAALRAASGALASTLQDKVLEDTPTEDFWRELRAAEPASVVLWLSASDLASVPPGIAPQVYVSFQETSGRVPPALLASQTEVRSIYPSDLPPKREARLLRSKLWLHNKGIALTDEPLQINTQFALTVASDVLGHIMDSYSRDFFVERAEHVVGQTPMPSMFQNVSLGPGQRFAAKGSYIVQVADSDKKQLKALSGWIVP